MWLQKLQERLAAVDLNQVEGPKDKAKSNEQVLGVANDEALRLWELRKRLHREGRQLAAKIVSAHLTDEEHDDLHYAKFNKELAVVGKEHELLSDLFLLSLRHQFDEHVIDGNIGIRENWWVVTWTDKKNDEDDQGVELQKSLRGFLEKFLPGMVVIR